MTTGSIVRGNCSVDGCGEPRLSRGWCNLHYKRWLAHGDPLAFHRCKGDRTGIVTKRVIDMVGRKCGRLTVIEQHGRIGRKASWRCSCECGAEIVVEGGNLRSGHTKSCGCLSVATARETNTVHGHSTTPRNTWAVWHGMIQRCSDPNYSKYHRYGGRGIKVCDRWLDYRNFLADMGERPNGMSIDRYPNNDGNYEPGNCRWATSKQQARNTSRNRLLSINGVTKCVAEWAECFGIKGSTVWQRVRQGWPLEQAVTRKVSA